MFPEPVEGRRDSLPDAGRSEAAARRRSNLTTRAIALVVVVLILTISYASSLRIYVAQSQAIAASQKEIADRQQKITDLQAELARWDDPAYVTAQARARLGWVMPGETGFKVVGADGKPVVGGGSVSASTGPPKAPRDAWWAKLWGSVEAADKPAPATPAKPTSEPTITEKSSPRPTPTTR